MARVSAKQTQQRKRNHKIKAGGFRLNFQQEIRGQREEWVLDKTQGPNKITVIYCALRIASYLL